MDLRDRYRLWSEFRCRDRSRVCAKGIWPSCFDQVAVVFPDVVQHQRRARRSASHALAAAICSSGGPGLQPKLEFPCQLGRDLGNGTLAAKLKQPLVGFRLTRWLYGLCWTGTERPSKLFERATDWLLAHKILLPGYSTLERFIVRLRSRVETKVWRLLGRGITGEQRKRLEYLLTVPEGRRGSRLDKLRSGPTRVSEPALRAAIERLKSVRELGITLPAAARIPEAVEQRWHALPTAPK